MAIIHEATNEVICKIVYHGAGKSGKTTNLMYMHHHLPEAQRGQFVSLETPTERTLFFDFLPVKAEARGYKFRYLLFATPGQEYYDASRKLVFKGADAIVFIVDSQRDRIQENWEALELMEKNLKDLGQRAEHIPTAIVYNKQDLPNILPLEDCERRFNPRHLLSFPAVARTGQGVKDPFLYIAKMAILRLSKAGSEAQMGELFRTLVITEYDAAHLVRILGRVNQEVGAVASMLIDENSGILASNGKMPSTDPESLGALLACNFTAAEELSDTLSRKGFVGIMQRGKRWVMRAARVDQRRFLFLACPRSTDHRRIQDAVVYFRGPLASYLKTMDSSSPGNLNRMSDVFTSVNDLALDGLAG